MQNASRVTSQARLRCARACSLLHSARGRRRLRSGSRPRSAAGDAAAEDACGQDAAVRGSAFAAPCRPPAHAACCSGSGALPAGCVCRAPRAGARAACRGSQQKVMSSPGAVVRASPATCWPRQAACTWGGHATRLHSAFCSHAVTSTASGRVSATAAPHPLSSARPSPPDGAPPGYPTLSACTKAPGAPAGAARRSQGWGQGARRAWEGSTT